MWCSYHKTTTHSDDDCHARLPNRPNGNAYFAQVCPPSVPGICSSLDLPVRDDSDEKLCLSFSVREVQSATKPVEAQVGEEKGAWSFGPVPTAATEGWSTRLWPFTPRAEPAISFGGPVAKGKPNLCRVFGMVDDKEPVEKALTASSSAAITPQDSVNSNLVIIMVDSGASGHYFDDIIIGHLKHRLQGYVHVASPEKLSLPGELCWTVRWNACCRVSSPTVTATKSSFGSTSWWCPGMGATYISSCPLPPKPGFGV